MRQTVHVAPNLPPDPEWDALVRAATPPSVFLTSGWLHAWASTQPHGPLVAVRIRTGDHLVAAAAFERQGPRLRFAGGSRSDYADVLLHGALSDDEALSALDGLLESARDASPGARYFQLTRLPQHSRARRLLERSRYFVSARADAEAPCMGMWAAPEKLGKKSLVRHERGLLRRGEVVCRTLRNSDAVLPRLDEFFDLHVRRWQGTPTPSLFLADENRRFYRGAARALAAIDALRFTELRLDERLVAAHFGFSWLGTFTWYKPCFEPELARLSPGEVLLKRLIEEAAAEGSERFDFTIGGEAFKHRFATEVPHVWSAHVTPSRLEFGIKRLRATVRRMLAEA